jgi:hypothetical protein
MPGFVLEKIEDEVLEVAFVEHPFRTPIPEIVSMEHFNLLILHIAIYLSHILICLLSAVKGSADSGSRLKWTPSADRMERKVLSGPIRINRRTS